MTLDISPSSPKLQTSGISDPLGKNFRYLKAVARGDNKDDVDTLISRIRVEF